jgi:hypothetical protein
MAERHEQNPVAERLMAVVEEEFGDRLDADGRERIRTGLERNLANAASLLMYPLENGDEPGTVFHATT